MKKHYLTSEYKIRNTKQKSWSSENESNGRFNSRIDQL